MSDHYTFITQVIFNDEERADRIEAELHKASEEHSLTFTRLRTPHGNSYFAGHFKNMGGGPWPEIFCFDDIEVVVLREDGVIFTPDGVVTLPAGGG